MPGFSHCHSSQWMPDFPGALDTSPAALAPVRWVGLLASTLIRIRAIQRDAVTARVPAGWSVAPVRFLLVVHTEVIRNPMCGGRRLEKLYQSPVVIYFFYFLFQRAHQPPGIDFPTRKPVRRRPAVIYGSPSRNSRCTQGRRRHQTVAALHYLPLGTRGVCCGSAGGNQGENTSSSSPGGPWQCLETVTKSVGCDDKEWPTTGFLQKIG